MNNTNSANAVQVLNNVIAVNLDISIWSGRKILEDNDLSLKGQVPPKEIINLGSKHTTDPEALKPFNKLKRRAERSCLRYGVPFLGGYAVPQHRAEELAKELSQIVKDFEYERGEYLTNHEATQLEWIEKYPDYKEILMKALTPVSYVAKRISASFSMFQIKSAENAIGFDGGLSNQLDSLGVTLDEDILKTSSKLLNSLSNAIAPNRTNVNTLLSLCEKVEGLAFLDSRFNSLVREIKKVEAQMPISGKLNVNEVSLLSGLLYRMSDPIKLESLMKNINDSNEIENAVVTDNQAITEPEDDFLASQLTGSFGVDADAFDIPNDITSDTTSEEFSFEADFQFDGDMAPIEGALDEEEANLALDSSLEDPTAKSMFF